MKFLPIGQPTSSGTVMWVEDHSVLRANDLVRCTVARDNSFLTEGKLYTVLQAWEGGRLMNHSSISVAQQGFVLVINDIGRQDSYSATRFALYDRPILAGPSSEYEDCLAAQDAFERARPLDQGTGSQGGGAGQWGNKIALPSWSIAQ
jgi:hypothetical protein